MKKNCTYNNTLFCRNKSCLKFILFILAFTVSTTTSAQRYWVSATGGLWSNAANWSATSGGTGGAGSPTGVMAIFDGSGGAIGNCTIDIAVSVSGFSVLPLYSGSIYQNTNAVTITGNSVWSGGNFFGGSAAITNSGLFTISGTNFTSTSSTLAINNTFNFSSGSFIHNSGTTRFNTNSFSVNGSPGFNNLVISGASNTITINNSIMVAGNLTLDRSSGNSLLLQIGATNTISVFGTTYINGSGAMQVNTGTIDIKGDLMITSTSIAGSGNGTFLISGTSNQLLSNSGSINQGKLPNVIINKPSGVLTLSGIISVIGPNWTYVSGIINPGTSTINFTKQSGGSNIIISGTHTLYDAIISSSFANTTINNNLTLNRNLTLDGASSSNDVQINSSITVNGTLYVTGSQYVNINIGLLDVKGDIINSNNAWAASGTGTVSITGAGNQLWSCSGAIDGQGTFPNILINKPSGILSLAGLINSLGPKWTYLAGTISPGTSTVCLYDNGSNPITISGTHTLNDMIIYPFNSVNIINNNLALNNLVIDGSSTHDLNINNTLTVNGKLTINGTNPVRLNNGTIHAKGDIETTNTSATSGGTSTLIINGAVNQNITGTGVVNQSRLPNTVILNKSSGGAYISGGVPFHFYNLVIFTQGVLYSTSAQLAYFYSGSTANGANALSYVNGPVRKRGNTAFTFPIGKSNFYAPFSISAPSNITHVFTAEYFNQNPNSSYNVSLKEVSLNNVSTCEYWILNQNTGASNVSVTPTWDARSCGVGNLPDLRVARWDGTIWRNHGNGGTTGTFAAGSVVSGSVVNTFIGPFTLASTTSLNVLPIELVSFTGKCENNLVMLNWITVSEINNDYFTLEKSIDGNDWIEITQVKSSGNSSTQQYYSYTDNIVPANKIMYYRLKQTDVNGTSKYFKITSVENCFDLKNDISVYPNPSNGIFILAGNYCLGEITIWDEASRKVFEAAVNDISYKIDLSSEPQGAYILNIKSQGFNNKTIKIIK
ncbi:MAG: T9SS type A sorting domain-containing protein [Bacteroidia bacterium]|nr:T9SS type A sorting domain-containing protein [Bacteroidia bacterium]